MASETTICNLALGKLGASRIISLSEASPEAQACSLQYEQTRDEVLRAHRWNFAITRGVFSQLATAPAFGWLYQWQLPVDCLRVLQVNGWEENEDPDNWEVEGRKLLTDVDSVQVKYIAQITDASQYDPLFIEALSIKLASKLCIALTGSGTRAGDFVTDYEKLTGPRARRTDAFESRDKRKPLWATSDLVIARA